MRHYSCSCCKFEPWYQNNYTKFIVQFSHIRYLFFHKTYNFKITMLALFGTMVNIIIIDPLVIDYLTHNHSLILSPIWVNGYPTSSILPSHLKLDDRYCNFLPIVYMVWIDRKFLLWYRNIITQFWLIL